MSRPIDPTKRNEKGEYISRIERWKSYNKNGGGDRQKITLYLTPAEAAKLARLGRREKVKGHTAIVRRAVEMALEVGKI
jgi:hypothetical protein